MFQLGAQKERGKDTETVFEHIMAENFSKLIKNYSKGERQSWNDVYLLYHVF